MKRAEAGRAAVMGGRPHPPAPSLAAAPAPAPPAAEAAPQLPVFSSQINCRASARRGVDKPCSEQVGTGQTRAEVAGSCPAGAYRAARPGRGSLPTRREGAEPAAPAPQAGA